MRRDTLQKGVAIGVTLSLILLIIAVFTPSFSAVKLSPGTPSKSSVTKDTTIFFNNVNLIIRSAEAIPVDYLMFTINRSSDDNMVAYVIFSLNGTKISEYPLNAFTVMNLTNTSTLPYQSVGSYYGYDEETGNVTEYNCGYGYGGVDLSILYNITYTTHISGTFYARLFVNSIIHTYASGASIPFTVTNNQSPPPQPPSPPSSNAAPVADAGGPYSGYVDKPITFSGAKSTDDTAVTGYRWDWTNDGTYDTNWSTIAMTTHSYTNASVYTIRLEVKDDENLTDSATTTVNVTITTDHFQEPIADAAGPYTGLTYQNIHFDGTNSYGINASIIYYVWAFGDGTYGYNVTSTHTYETAGTFTVFLTITDSNNLIAIDTTTATIELDANRNNVSDIIDQTIGVDIDQSDLHSISIDGVLYYLVDTNDDDIYDTFYNPTTSTKTTLGQQDGKQLIDIDGDGDWEYLYNPTFDSITTYEKTSSLFDSLWVNVLLIIGIIIVIAVILFFWFYRNGYI